MSADTTITVRGMTFGNGPNIWIGDQHIQFGTAELRSTEEPQPNRDGVAFGGVELLGGRDLNIPILIYTANAGGKVSRILQAVEFSGDLGQAWRPSAHDLILAMTLGGARTFIVYGRPHPLAPDSLRTLWQGFQSAVLRWRMSRPYIYDSQVIETVVDVLGEAESGGLGYPHGYPHGYGGEAAQGQAVHTAGGRIDTWPVIVLRAGDLDNLINPTIINDLTGERLGLDTTIDPSAQLVVDMYRQRVYATQVGADVMGADPSLVSLVDRSSTVRHPTDNDWWGVGPEPTPIRLTGSGAGSAHVLTRGAYYL